MLAILDWIVGGLQAVAAVLTLLGVLVLIWGIRSAPRRTRRERAGRGGWLDGHFDLD